MSDEWRVIRNDSPGLAPHSASFYEPSAIEVAPRLLGQYLLRNTPDGLCGGLIVETEAYLTNDPACHAYKSETARNRTMWGKFGRGYVYLIYGRYFCFNAVCRPAGIAEAVLVRAIKPTHGLEWMRQHRPAKNDRDLTNGPGKLCDALQIHRAHDGVDLCNLSSPVFIAANPQPPQNKIIVTTRIGISLAADWPLRFFYQENDFVSRRVLRGHEFHEFYTPEAASEYSEKMLDAHSHSRLK